MSGRRGMSASPEQRTKVRDERCRICKRSPCDPAHVIARAQGGCDQPECVVPLCRECHRTYDQGTGFDLLPFLTSGEQAHAVLHAGIVGAYRRTTGERL